jgi:hypothetical protein
LDVFTLTILVALDNIVFLNGFVTFGGDFLVPDALSGSPVNLMKANLALCFGGRNQVNSERDKRDLQVTGPEWTRHDTKSSSILIPQQEQALPFLFRCLSAWRAELAGESQRKVHLL